MFARSVVRSAARRSFRPIAAQTPVFRAGFRSSVAVRDPETVNEKAINVVSYVDGERAQESIPVTSSQEPVTPPGQDETRPAVPLSPALASQLTPTLAKFTLVGKTAMVTG